MRGNPDISRKLNKKLTGGGACGDDDGGGGGDDGGGNSGDGGESPRCYGDSLFAGGRQWQPGTGTCCCYCFLALIKMFNFIV